MIDNEYMVEWIQSPREERLKRKLTKQYRKYFLPLVHNIEKSRCGNCVVIDLKIALSLMYVKGAEERFYKALEASKVIVQVNFRDLDEWRRSEFHRLDEPMACEIFAGRLGRALGSAATLITLEISGETRADGFNLFLSILEHVKQIQTLNIQCSSQMESGSDRHSPRFLEKTFQIISNLEHLQRCMFDYKDDLGSTIASALLFVPSVRGVGLAWNSVNNLDNALLYLLLKSFPKIMIFFSFESCNISVENLLLMDRLRAEGHFDDPEKDLNLCVRHIGVDCMMQFQYYLTALLLCSTLLVSPPVTDRRQHVSIVQERASFLGALGTAMLNSTDSKYKKLRNLQLQRYRLDVHRRGHSNAEKKPIDSLAPFFHGAIASVTSIYMPVFREWTEQVTSMFTEALSTGKSRLEEIAFPSNSRIGLQQWTNVITVLLSKIPTLKSLEVGFEGFSDEYLACTANVIQKTQHWLNKLELFKENRSGHRVSARGLIAFLHTLKGNTTLHELVVVPREQFLLKDEQTCIKLAEAVMGLHGLTKFSFLPTLPSTNRNAQWRFLATIIGASSCRRLVHDNPGNQPMLIDLFSKVNHDLTALYIHVRANPSAFASLNHINLERSLEVDHELPAVKKTRRYS